MAQSRYCVKTPEYIVFIDCRAQNMALFLFRSITEGRWEGGKHHSREVFALTGLNFIVFGPRNVSCSDRCGVVLLLILEILHDLNVL